MKGKTMGLASRASAEPPPEAAQGERVRALVGQYHSFAWRLVRRLGVPASDAEDAVQQVFIVVARRLVDIAPGSERAFVVSTAIRVAADARRAARRKPVELHDELDEFHDGEAPPDELAEHFRARRLLDELLDDMPNDVRGVFVLFEIEELSLTEIANVLEIPRGTVASRLARARTWFSERLAVRGGAPARKGDPP